jgi:hypothetical protein
VVPSKPDETSQSLLTLVDEREISSELIKFAVRSLAFVWLLVALAFGIGLFVGWLIWG